MSKRHRCAANISATGSHQSTQHSRESGVGDKASSHGAPPRQDEMGVATKAAADVVRTWQQSEQHEAAGQAVEAAVARPKQVDEALPS